MPDEKDRIGMGDHLFEQPRPEPENRVPDRRELDCFFKPRRICLDRMRGQFAWVKHMREAHGWGFNRALEVWRKWFPPVPVSLNPFDPNKYVRQPWGGYATNEYDQALVDVAQYLATLASLGSLTVLEAAIHQRSIAELLRDEKNFDLVVFAQAVPERGGRKEESPQ